MCGGWHGRRWRAGVSSGRLSGASEVSRRPSGGFKPCRAPNRSNCRSETMRLRQPSPVPGLDWPSSEARWTPTSGARRPQNLGHVQQRLPCSSRRPGTTGTRRYSPMEAASHSNPPGRARAPSGWLPLTEPASMRFSLAPANVQYSLDGRPTDGESRSTAPLKAAISTSTSSSPAAPGRFGSPPMLPTVRYPVGRRMDSGSISPPVVREGRKLEGARDGRAGRAGHP